MFKLMHYGETNVGRERKNNEDTFRAASDGGVFLVCDGMGGHASGEIASQVAADAMVRFLTIDRHRADCAWPPESQLHSSDEGRALDAAVRVANREVLTQAHGNPLHKGMGTTVVAVLASRERLAIVHVGDSRVYRYRAGELEQVTEDHSLLNHYLRTRPMSAQQIQSFAGKNVIVRAVGLRDQVEPEIQLRDYRKGDVYLLCSDGLNDMVGETEIAQLMRHSPYRLRETGEALIRAALAHGGKDNVTVLLLQVVDASEAVTSEAGHGRGAVGGGAAAEGMARAMADDDDDEEEHDISNVETLPEIRVTLPPPLVEKTQPVKALSPEEFQAAIRAHQQARAAQGQPPRRLPAAMPQAERTQPISRAELDAVFEAAMHADTAPGQQPPGSKKPGEGNS
jgi:serine/threonine protein phosphatase PrpC